MKDGEPLGCSRMYLYYLIANLNLEAGAEPHLRSFEVIGKRD